MTAGGPGAGPVVLDLEYGPLGHDSWWLRTPDGKYLHVDDGTLEVLQAIDGRLTPEEAVRQLDLDPEELDDLLAALAEHGAVRRGPEPGLRQAGTPRDRLLPWLLAAAAAGALVQACFFAFGRPTLTATGTEALAALLLVLASVPLHEGAHWLAARGSGPLRVGLTRVAVVFPTVYVEAQGAWSLSRSRRCAIDVAGVAADAAAGGAAALAGLLAPGVSAVTTAFLVTQLGRAVLALNPLMQSDGYWLLSDLAGVPNLSLRAQESLQALRPHWLTAYAVLCYAFAGLGFALLAAFAVAMVMAAARAL